MQQRTTRVNPSEETIKIGPLGIRFLLTSDDSNGSVSVFEVLVPARQKQAAPAHKNDAYEEMLYGIEGVLTWTVEGTPIELGPGQALCIPRGAVHRFDNLGSADVKQLAVITPAIMGPAYFREAAEVIGAAAGGLPDRVPIKTICTVRKLADGSTRGRKVGRRAMEIAYGVRASGRPIIAR